MQYDKSLISHKLARWDRFITDYHLPDWETIPDLGLYMDQVIVLLEQYLTFIPTPAGSKEKFVTSSTINNYVRLKIMPAPVKRSLGFLLASIALWFIGYNGVTTWFTTYVAQVMGEGLGGASTCLMVATGVAVVSYLPIGFLSSRFGRKKMILAGILLMCAAYVSGIFFGHFSPLLYVVFGLTGVGWASINVNSYPMVVEMGSGADVGKYTGMYYFFSMGAQVFTPIFSGVLLEHISYRTLFPYAAVFSLLSFITMLFVRHGDVKPQKKASVLENFDVDDG